MLKKQTDKNPAGCGEKSKEIFNSKNSSDGFEKDSFG